MSREQLTDQQSQQDTAGPEAAPQNTHGLPPALHAQVMRLGPGDAQALRDLLTLYPVFSSGILAVAAPHMGNAAVQRAIAMVQQNAVGQPLATSGPEYQERLGGLESNAVGRPPASAASPEANRALLTEIPMDGQAMPAARPKPLWMSQPPPSAASPEANRALLMEIPMDDQAMPGTAAKPAAEPAWVAGARTYNDAHAGLVSEFNDATANSCLDASGQLDPQAVARWQRQHGVEADGKVGPHTLAAARQASAKAGPAAAADQRVPV